MPISRKMEAVSQMQFLVESNHSEKEKPETETILIQSWAE